MTESNKQRSFQFGITSPSQCSYLPEQQERLLVALDEELQQAENLELLFANGFRRSGDQVYRPHCINCHACHAIRIPVEAFVASKSQKRLIKKNCHLTKRVSTSLKAQYYALYEAYINEIHTDGAMFPPNYEQYTNFLSSTKTTQHFIELWDNDTLVSVAVTDVFEHSCSALYTFYHPSYRRNSIGMYSILEQIEYCKELGKEFLYLGYQIDACQKMNYKTQFHPHQRIINNCWQWINK